MKSTSISASVRMAEGSSRMSTLALPASALAIETCCCSAIDRSPTGRGGVAGGQADGVEQLDHPGVLGGPVDPAAAHHLAPTKMFSETLSSAKSCGSW